MRIRFKQDWRRHVKGEVVDRDGGVADLLIRRGICEDADAAPLTQSARPLEVAAARTVASRPNSPRRTATASGR
jgi:hypothetical protein